MCRGPEHISHHKSFLCSGTCHLFGPPSYKAETRFFLALHWEVLINFSSFSTLESYSESPASKVSSLILQMYLSCFLSERCKTVDPNKQAVQIILSILFSSSNELCKKYLLWSFREEKNLHCVSALGIEKLKWKHL